MKQILFSISLSILSLTSLAQNTVFDIISNSPEHDTLEAAVVAAELADDLSGPGPFTVFAPTDEAFAALPVGTIETLLTDATGTLAQILLYHVVGGTTLSTELIAGPITTLQGQDVIVSFEILEFTQIVITLINGSTVIVTDILADNGVVHVIDAVLLPQIDVPGCTDTLACNYDSTATIDDSSCYFIGMTCDDGDSLTTYDIYTTDCICAGELVLQVTEENHFDLKFQNPVANNIQFNIPNRANIQIISSNGQSILNQNFTNTVNINTDNLTTGLYFMKLSGDNYTQVVKIVK